MTHHRLPTYYVSHGGGPWPWMLDMFAGTYDEMAASLRRIPTDLGTVPRAVLVVSAHWEAASFTVSASPAPPMYYDYGGFPEHTYSVQYPAPGDPDLAAHVEALLSTAGLSAALDHDRGFDHGTFVPLAVMYPDASVPVVQLSLREGYDPDEHLAAGRAISSLRDDGVLIVGSGLSFHNMRLVGDLGREPSAEFDRWLNAVVVGGPVGERGEQLRNWENAPGARAAHPWEEHLMPLHVVAGAADEDAATLDYHQRDFFGGVTMSSFRFGELPTPS